MIDDLLQNLYDPFSFPFTAPAGEENWVRTGRTAAPVRTPAWRSTICWAEGPRATSAIRCSLGSSAAWMGARLPHTPLGSRLPRSAACSARLLYLFISVSYKFQLWASIKISKLLLLFEPNACTCPPMSIDPILLLCSQSLDAYLLKNNFQKQVIDVVGELNGRPFSFVS
jgi:hypothetical protein